MSASEEQARLRARVEQLEAERRTLEARAFDQALELALAQTEAARGQQFVDHVLAAMSHELRTPLMTILGLTEALIDGAYGPPQPKQGECLQTLAGAGRSLLGRIEDLLDLARAGAGRLALEIAVLSVDKLVRAAAAAAEPAAAAKGVRLVVVSGEELGPLHGDERRLRRSLGHLLDNAIRFSPPGAAVLLEASLDGADARLVIQDGGAGMDPRAAAQALRPFEGDRSLARSSGAGVGLTVAARVAELHGGSVAIESAAGTGTRVIVTLPRALAGSSASALGRTFVALGARVRHHLGAASVGRRAIEVGACAIVLGADLDPAERAAAVKDLDGYASTARLPRLVVEESPRPEALAAFVDALPGFRPLLVVGPGAAAPPDAAGASTPHPP